MKRFQRITVVAFAGGTLLKADGDETYAPYRRTSDNHELRNKERCWYDGLQQ